MGRKLLKPLLQFFIFAVVFFLLLLLIRFFEYQNEDSSIKTFFDAFWFSIVTLTTVGYGDFYPVTKGGKIVGLILILLSLGFLGYVISNITNKIQSYMEKKKLGQFGTSFTDHMVIIGWNNFGRLITEQIVKANQKVAVVTNSKDDVDLIHDQFDDNVFVLYSELNNYEAFQKINISKSASVFINIPSDSDALVYLINLRKQFPNLNLVVALTKSELKETFYSAGADYVVSEKEISSKLIASFIFEPDVAHFAEDLISTATSELAVDMWEFQVTEQNPFVNTDYFETYVHLKKEFNAVLLGVCKSDNANDYRLLKNPPEGTKIENNDYLILVCDGQIKQNIEKKFGVKEGRKIRSR
jgi:voltage-gated potassium channel